MENFTTVQLPRDISPKDLGVIQKSCFRILSKGNLRLDGSAVFSLDFFGKTLLADIALFAENTGKKCVLSGFSPELRTELSQLTINRVPPKEG